MCWPPWGRKYACGRNTFAGSCRSRTKSCASSGSGRCRRQSCPCRRWCNFPCRRKGRPRPQTRCRPPGWRQCEIPPGFFPGIVGGAPVGEVFTAPVVILPIGPEIHIRRQFAAIPNRREILRLGATTTFHIKPLRVLRALGGDVNDPVHRICPHRVPPGPLMTSMRSMSSSK